MTTMKKLISITLLGMVFLASCQKEEKLCFCSSTICMRIDPADKIQVCPDPINPDLHTYTITPDTTYVEVIGCDTLRFTQDVNQAFYGMVLRKQKSEDPIDNHLAEIYRENWPVVICTDITPDGKIIKVEY